MTVNKRRVLVIEDQPLLREIIKDFLSEEGFDVTLTQDGVTALNLLEKTPFDCVVTDLYMPEMDGIMLTLKIKMNKNLRHIPVVMLSSETKEEVIKQAKEAGVSKFITKPATGDKIAKEIKSLFPDS